MLLELTGAPAGATATLVIGFAPLRAPFKGGTLVPLPTLLLPGLPVRGDGKLALGGTWPPGLPADTTLYLQHWIAHPPGPAGFVASGGLAGTTP